ncbi:hypothetical protein [Falsiroseomonas sp. HW251]|uniref:hypothetical protein n=1 Tax=Falsiroseomonas sp. HW251 TaxID=3390998 RepID=UPI003D31EB3B
MSLTILPVALFLAVRPAEAALPSPPGMVVHLCPDERRAEGEACVFGFGPGRRLAVPWSVLEAPRTMRADNPRVSTYGIISENERWPLGTCMPAGDCLPSVGRSGRREALPGRQPRIYEQWLLCGRLSQDGRVEHERSCPAPFGPGAPVAFTLNVRTDLASNTQGFERSLFKTPTRTVELWRRCDPGNEPRQTCEVHGGRDGLVVTIYWWDWPDIPSATMFAAAASLFDRYVVEGTGFGH